MCGVIYSHKEKLIFLQCQNFAKDRVNSFLIDPLIFIKYKIKYIVHSHIIGPSTPSQKDKVSAKECCIPFLIYSLKDDDFTLYEI